MIHRGPKGAKWFKGEEKVKGKETEGNRRGTKVSFAYILRDFERKERVNVLLNWVHAVESTLSEGSVSCPFLG